MQVAVERVVAWKDDVYLKDMTFGHNGVFLTPAQLDTLLSGEFPEGASIVLPQPDASHEPIAVIRHAQSWHFIQPEGRELIITAEDWPALKAAMLAIYTPTREG